MNKSSEVQGLAAGARPKPEPREWNFDYTRFTGPGRAEAMQRVNDLVRQATDGEPSFLPYTEEEIAEEAIAEVEKEA